jgi:ribosomal protein L37AE/L43A
MIFDKMNKELNEAKKRRSAPIRTCSICGDDLRVDGFCQTCGTYTSSDYYARKEIENGYCPKCGEEALIHDDVIGLYDCDNCGRTFNSQGKEIKDDFESDYMEDETDHEEEQG